MAYKSTVPIVGSTPRVSKSVLAGVPSGPGTGKPVTPGVPVKPADPGLSMFGQSLTAPTAPSAIATPGLAGPISAALTQAQNQANNANQQRYQQQLGVLTGGYNQSAQDYQNALAATSGMGTAAKQNIALNLQNAQGATAQSAVTRGIGNTSVVDALQQGNQRTANNATQAVNEGVANQQIGIMGQQAQNANQGAGAISQAIAARNDTGPNPALYAQLQQQAAAASVPNVPRDSLGRQIINGGTQTFGGTGMFTLH